MTEHIAIRALPLTDNVMAGNYKISCNKGTLSAIHDINTQDRGVVDGLIWVLPEAMAKDCTAFFATVPQGEPDHWRLIVERLNEVLHCGSEAMQTADGNEYTQSVIVSIEQVSS